MATKKVQKRLKHGKFHIMGSDGIREIKKPGDIVELTPGQVVNFADQFEDPGERVRADEQAQAVREADEAAKDEAAAEAKEKAEEAEAKAAEEAEEKAAEAETKAKETKASEAKPKAKAS